MTHRIFSMASAAALLAASTINVDAQPRHVGIVAHHHRHYAGASSHAGTAGFRYSPPVDPRYGYEEAPYDPSYQGPGADVFAATKKAQHEPGVTLDLEPDAKETATGGPVGGIPGHDGT